MDANKLNGWLALAGNLAVLVGIILLVVEIRQNADLMRAQISMDRSIASRQIAVQVANGGEFLPIDATSLLLANAQTFSWMIPVILSGIGIGLFVVSRKSE